jgi:hypothetical protein
MHPQKDAESELLGEKHKIHYIQLLLTKESVKRKGVTVIPYEDKNLSMCALPVPGGWDLRTAKKTHPNKRWEPGTTPD